MFLFLFLFFFYNNHWSPIKYVTNKQVIFFSKFPKRVSFRDSEVTKQFYFVTVIDLFRDRVLTFRDQSCHESLKFRDTKVTKVPNFVTQRSRKSQISWHRGHECLEFRDTTVTKVQNFVTHKSRKRPQFW